jgi:thioredoxin reductase (NADPH)
MCFGILCGALKVQVFGATRVVQAFYDLHTVPLPPSMVFMDSSLDVIIVGGGPIGLACGLEARKAGLEYVILEKGCLVNSLYHYPSNMTFFSTSERIEIGEVPFVSNNIKPTRPEALEYYRRIAVSNRLNIHLEERVTEVRPGPEDYFVQTSIRGYHTRYIILATGFYDIPVLMQVPGEELPKVSHYYKEPHFYVMRKVVVVGANNSAVDAALETFRKGAEVTMVVRSEDIGKRVKYWVRPDIENRIKEGSIRAFFSSELVAIRETAVDIRTPGGLLTIPNDYVLAMTGYQPDFAFLRKLGIRLSDDEKMAPAYDPATMETNQKNLYLAGVVCGGMDTHVWFIENSRVHATMIFRDILSKETERVSA